MSWGKILVATGIVGIVGIAGFKMGEANANKKNEKRERQKDRKMAKQDDIIKQQNASINELNASINELKEENDSLRAELAQALNELKSDLEYFNFIYCATRFGVAMAYADGFFCKEEKDTINEFIGGISSNNYPYSVKEKLSKIMDLKISFKYAMSTLKYIPMSSRPAIRDLLELVMHSDGVVDENEKRFLRIFDNQVDKIEYIQSSGSYSNSKNFLNSAKQNLLVA